MKLKDIVNKNTPEIIQKLVYGLDFNVIYAVEFLRDGSVEVREVEKVRNKETDDIMYIEK